MPKEPSVHFADRQKKTLEDLLQEPIVDAIIQSIPLGPDGQPGRITEEDCADRTKRLLALSYAAHYDLGWPWQRIRDSLKSWCTKIILGIRIDLDAEGGMQGAPEGGVRSNRWAGRNKPPK